MALVISASHYSCGIMEMGNFNYVKDMGPKGMPHYHKIGGWVRQAKAPETTEQEIRFLLEGQVLQGGCGGVTCSTGADQEYVEPILEKLGFVGHEFVARSHEKGRVKLWFLDVNKYKKAEPVLESKKPDKEKAQPSK